MIIGYRDTYLGDSFPIPPDNPFRDYTTEDWALYFIGSYGQTPGDHHKQWVLDQVARILNGADIDIKLAKWSTGEENYRITVKEPTPKYHAWVKELGGWYDTGIAP